jgi:plasmid replication initiation protein
MTRDGSSATSSPPGVASFPQLLDTTGVYPQLRPGSEGIRVVRQWTGVIAGHYYRLAHDAIRAADPEALILGDRLPIYYDPVAVRAMVPYVDAISVNYNVDSPDGWLARYFFDGLRYLAGDKPVLISEWFFAARDNRSGNRNHGHLLNVDTQAERVRGAAAAERFT